MGMRAAAAAAPHPVHGGCPTAWARCCRRRVQVLDITRHLAPPGQPNRIEYWGFYNGTVPAPDQTGGTIMLSADLALWEQA